eukprot:8727665-Ditylum_brightwellii.AAC.1
MQALFPMMSFVRYLPNTWGYPAPAVPPLYANGLAQRGSKGRCNMRQRMSFMAEWHSHALGATAHSTYKQ